MMKMKKILVLLYSSLIISLMFFGHVNANYPENRCLEFDGDDDYASCASSVYKAKELTVEFWIKPKYTVQIGSHASYGNTIEAIIRYTETWASEGGWTLYFDFSDGHLYFEYRHDRGYYVDRTDTAFTNRAVWNSSSLYHVAVTFSPSSDSITFYVNKTIDKTYSYDIFGLEYESADLKIGGHLSYGYMFQGLIDEVRFWNASRTHSEVINSWTRVLDLSECAQPELIGYWRFDEGYGLESEDFSTQGNNAVLGLTPYNPEWTEIFGAPIIPEFPSFLILPLFMIATLIAVIVSKRNIPHG